MPGTDWDAWDPVKSPPLLVRAARQHCLLYAELAKEALLICVFGTFWRVYPKHHLFLHCVEDCPGNPREFWNYFDESEIGAAAKLAAHMHPSTLPTALIERYRL